MSALTWNAAIPIIDQTTIPPDNRRQRHHPQPPSSTPLSLSPSLYMVVQENRPTIINLLPLPVFRCHHHHPRVARPPLEVHLPLLLAVNFSIGGKHMRLIRRMLLKKVAPHF